MAKSLLVRSRSSAFDRQHGRCFYCQCLMWRHSVASFAAQYGLTLSQAATLQCTAEHLLARQDHGSDAAENIVAACRICNTRRHARAAPLSPTAYLVLVRQRMARGAWHSIPMEARHRLSPVN